MRWRSGGFLIFDFNHGSRTYQAPGGQTKQLPDEWYETVVPVSIYTNARLSEIRLYPAVIESSGGPAGGLPTPSRCSTGDEDSAADEGFVCEIRNGGLDRGLDWHHSARL